MTAVDVDALDAALSKVQPPVSVFAGLTQDREYPSDVNALYRDGGSAAFAECYGEDSAALIVAAVNALPELLAEVRRGRALRERLKGLAWRLENEATDAFASWDTLAAKEDAADCLRAVLAAEDPS